MNRIWLWSLVFVCGLQAVHADESELPANIMRLMKQTEEQAVIPLWNLSYEPQTDLLFSGLGSAVGVGSIGQVDSYEVVQIVDERNMLAKLRWKQPRRYKIQGPNGKHFWKLEKLVAEVWLTNQSTTGLIDDASYRPGGDGVFEITGTKRYESLGGVRTVHLAVPVNVSRYRDQFAKLAESRKRRLKETSAKNAAEEEAEKRAEEEVREKARRAKEIARLTRTWSDPSGSYTLKAVYAGLKSGGIVMLNRTDDGTRIEVKTSRLSKADRDWIRNVGSVLIPLEPSNEP